MNILAVPLRHYCPMALTAFIPTTGSSDETFGKSYSRQRSQAS
jgi:hypothetical protein